MDQMDQGKYRQPDQMNQGKYRQPDQMDQGEWTRWIRGNITNLTRRTRENGPQTYPPNLGENINDWNKLDINLTTLLWHELPSVLNTSDHDSPDSLNLREIAAILWENQQYGVQDISLTATHALADYLASSGVADITNKKPEPLRKLQKKTRTLASASASSTAASTSKEASVSRAAAATSEAAGTKSAAATASLTSKAASVSSADDRTVLRGPQASASSRKRMAFASRTTNTLKPLLGPTPRPPIPSRAPVRMKRAAEGGWKDGETGKLLYNLTHYFHLGSMVILSALLLECLMKVLASGRKILHHKLELFDIFVVAVSWSLDVAFWRGIWAHPETEAATILIIMLPWRIIRIVNSFVLVIQEKDQVMLKIVKQRLRLSVKKGREAVKKASSYKTEANQLQSLSRKYGAADTELISCIPEDRQARRRRSNPKPFLPYNGSSLSHNDSSLTLNALRVFADLQPVPDSSSDEDDVTIPRDISREEPTLCSEFSVDTLDEMFLAEGGNESMPVPCEGGVSVGALEGLNNSAFQADSETTSGNDDRSETGSVERYMKENTSPSAI
ncbi:hypothetical protein ACOMHN_022394 [Nucella lapillus]